MLLWERLWTCTVLIFSENFRLMAILLLGWDCKRVFRVKNASFKKITYLTLCWIVTNLPLASLVCPLIFRSLDLLTVRAFSRFTPGLGALGSTAGSSGTNGSTSASSENPSPTVGTTEPGHQQFIQQMLQALAGVNPQVMILFCSS